MNSNFTEKTVFNLIAKIDVLTEKILTLTETVESQTNEVRLLRNDLTEKNAVINALEETIKSLQEKLGKNSKNSSKPPSTDGFNKPKPKSLRKPSGRKAGAQKGHKGSGLKLEREPDETIQHFPKACLNCPNHTTCTACTVCDTRYEVDVIIKTKIVRHELLICNCPLSNKHQTGEFPKNINGTIQYGNNIKSLAVTLNTFGMMSYQRVHDYLSSVFDVPISVGTISKMVTELGAKTTDVVASIREKVIGLAIMNADETGLNVNSKTHWVHSASNHQYTYLTVHKKRGKEGMDHAGVLPRYNGIVVHDFWKSYYKYDKINHAVCNAHLLRELTGVIDNNPDQTWSKDMIKLLLQMKNHKDNLIFDNFNQMSERFLEAYSHKYDKILEEAISKNPIPEKVKGKRGRVAKGKVRALIDRFVTHKSEVCLFINNFAVPFDNNQAERDIRMIKVKQKVSGGFRTCDGADNYMKIMSYIGTAKKHGLDIFKAIREVFVGDPLRLLGLTTE